MGYKNHMSKRIPIPCAIFDTVETIGEDLPNCVIDYLSILKIPEAMREYHLTQQFLASYAGSADTYTSYRREVERLLQWSWLIAKKPVVALNRNDIREYLDFSHSPPLSWIALQNFPRFKRSEGIKIQNKAWRPFVVRINKAKRRLGELPQKEDYQLASKSIQALFAGLSTYFNFLQQEEYVEANPIALIRQKSRYIQRQQTQKVTRKLSHLQWEYVIETAKQLVEKNKENERTLFLISAFYLLGLRISELAETPGRIPKMGDFAPDKHGLWWFSTVGKGNKMRDVAVPDAMLEALKRYRQSCGLTPLPIRDENTPLLHRQRGRGGLGTRQVRNLVQECFNQAIFALERASKQDEAMDLASATVHWLRHTAISSDIEFRPREHVRDDVGHENAATMDKYIDIDRLARHASAKNKPLIPLAKETENTP